MASIENLKSELLNFNETHLIKLVYHMATKLALSEIKDHQELILEVVKGAIADAQNEEKVTLRVAATDMQFLQNFQSQTGQQFEFLKRLKIVESSDVTPGGCVVETNYGVVDASIEKRVENLWAGLAEKMPKVKDIIESK